MRVLPVSTHYDDYAFDVRKKLRDAGLQAEADVSSNKLGYKMRAAQQDKIPYVFVVGEKEKLSGGVNVRRHDDEAQVMTMLREAVGILVEKIRNRR